MALYRCSGGGSNFIKEFSGKTYITTGLSVVQSRCSIEDGGYCVENGYCYVKIKIKSNYAFNTSQALNGFPNVSKNKPAIESENEIGKTTYINFWDSINGSIQKYSTQNILYIDSLPSGQTKWFYCKYPI